MAGGATRCRSRQTGNTLPLRNVQAPIRLEREGTKGHFPQVAVRVLEVPAVATPERLARLLHDFGASFPSLFNYLIHFGLGAGVVRQGDAVKTAALGLQLG